MTPYVLQVGDVTEQHLCDYHECITFIESYPDDYTCHEVCEFLEKYLGDWTWVKGKFNGFDHSWLRHKTDDVILDAYPWCAASGPVLIYTGCTLNPWKNLYKES